MFWNVMIIYLTVVYLWCFELSAGLSLPGKVCFLVWESLIYFFFFFFTNPLFLYLFLLDTKLPGLIACFFPSISCHPFLYCGLNTLSSMILSVLLNFVSRQPFLLSKAQFCFLPPFLLPLSPFSLHLPFPFLLFLLQEFASCFPDALFLFISLRIVILVCL